MSKRRDCLHKAFLLICGSTDLIHRGSVVGMGYRPWQASVMQICRMQVVQMMRMMLRMDVIFLIIIRHQLHSALSLDEEKININIKRNLIITQTHKAMSQYLKVNKLRKLWIRKRVLKAVTIDKNSLLTDFDSS